MDSALAVSTHDLDLSLPEILSEEDRYYAYPVGSVVHVDFYPEAPISEEERVEPDEGDEEHASSTRTDEGTGGRRRGLEITGSASAEESTPTPAPIRTSFTVVRTFSRTLSCVLLVKLSGPPIPPFTSLNSTPSPTPTHTSSSSTSSFLSSTNTSFSRPSSSQGAHSTTTNPQLFVLKICDRRFSMGLRDDYDALPWTPEIEAGYERFEALPESVKPQIVVGGKEDSWYNRPDSDDEGEGGAKKDKDGEKEGRNAGEKEKEVIRDVLTDRRGASPTPANVLTQTQAGNTPPAKKDKEKERKRKRHHKKRKGKGKGKHGKEVSVDKPTLNMLGPMLVTLAALTPQAFKGTHATTDRPKLPNQTVTSTKAKPEESAKTWTTSHNEAYMQKVADGLFKSEVGVYRHLRGLQGRKVPHLHGTLRLVEVIPPSSSASSSPISRRTSNSDSSWVRPRTATKHVGEIRGILLQYLRPSFSLRDIPTNIPDRSRWQDVGQSAVKIVQDIGDRGVLNEDVRLDNILFVPVTRPREVDLDTDSESQDPIDYQPFMIDFGLARLQRTDESDDEFRKMRRQQDEEGAVGHVLEKHLWKSVQAAAASKTVQDASKGEVEVEKPFVFQHSLRLYRPWDNDEED